MKKELTQLRGDRENPFHLSVGQVCMRNKKVAVIQKSNGELTLPRETTYLEESYFNALIRGAHEEIGASITVEKLLGSLITFFNRDSNTIVEKTTIYFLTTYTEELPKLPEQDELNDTVIWLKLSDAITKFLSQSNREAEILKRVV